MTPTDVVATALATAPPLTADQIESAARILASVDGIEDVAA